MESLLNIKENLKLAITELVDFAKLGKGSLLVLGCPTSEVIVRKLVLWFNRGKGVLFMSQSMKWLNQEGLI